MAKKEKNLDPHRPAGIQWRDGQKKEIVLKNLSHPAVKTEMPKEFWGDAGKMVLWAAQTVRSLAEAGRLGSNPKMFSDKPEEVKGLEDRIEKLEAELVRIQTRNTGLTAIVTEVINKHRSDMTREELEGVFVECLNRFLKLSQS